MRPPLYESVSDQIRAMVQDGRLPKGSRLPGEDELARLLQVGRSTLREALRALEQDGLIIRRHGIGNFVSNNFDRMRGNLETLESFVDSIRRSGYSAHMETVLVGVREAPAAAAEALEISVGDPAVYVELLYYGNGRPAIFTRSYVPMHLVDPERLKDPHWSWSSIRQYLREKRGIVVRCASLTVRAVRAEGKVAEHLHAEPGGPLLLLEGPSYSEQGESVHYIEAFFNTDVYQFHLVRR